MNLPDYIHKCEVCNASKVSRKPLLSEVERLLFLEQVYHGDYDVNHLPSSFYIKNSRELEESLKVGFGEIKTEKQNDKFLKMRRNVYFFSAAKTYNMIEVLQKDRKEKTFKEYKEANSHYLENFVGIYNEAENDHAKQCGKVAKQWVKLEDKKTAPYLEYVTMKDNRVRPAHVYLDGITRILNDNFWNTYMPPNGWRCRCKVKSYPTGENTSLKDFDNTEALQNIPVMFRTNFGKAGVVFPHDHPYFKNVDKNLARNNFNLPLPYESKHGK